MTTDLVRTVGLRPLAWPSLLALIAAALAAIPLVLSRLDSDADLDPFFLALVVAAVLIAILVGRQPVSRAERFAAGAIALAWLAAGAFIFVLLVMYQTACGCSFPDPASLPPARTWAGLSATFFHVLATYGGGLLVALAAFGPIGMARRRP